MALFRKNNLWGKLRKSIPNLMLTVFLFTVILVPASKPVAAYSGIPTISIVSAVEDVSVTIKTNNFPANETFTVRMGVFGTMGIGGTIVGTTNSGAGGIFEETYSIPASLAGSAQIAIRLESASGYYAYNWFTNSSTSSSTPTPDPSYTGIPSFSITDIQTDSSVTIRTSNFPANTEFTVRMGAFGTMGIGGTIVATTNSGAGGSFEETYTIPAVLQGSSSIAIRMESADGYYYAYNWFYNNTTSTSTSSSTGVPAFSIVSAVTDTSVTISTSNFPANMDFTVKMGAFGTMGIGGTVVATTNSGSGGSFEETYSIPASLAGSAKIAIRLESTSSGHYAYNWFYNSSSTSSTTSSTGIPTITIVSAVKDSTVTIETKNFPPNVDFTVRMGLFGTKAVGGDIVATTPSGSGGTFHVTYTIPASLHGESKIAIRLDSADGYYYSYNWFYNQ